MSLFEERLADLPLHIEGYALEGLTRDVSSAFTRVSTVIRMHGGGEEGVGEDVTYDADDHEILQAAGAVLPLAGEWTLGSFCDHVEALDLWPAPPQREPSRLYRVWAYESTALDLALRQAGTSLHAAVGREPRPVRFVVSLRLGEPPTLDPVARRLERYPSLRFKLDATTEWTPELIAELVATGAVDSVDFKGLYVGSIVDQPADPVLYRRVVEAFPDAWIEDPEAHRGDRRDPAPPPRPHHLGRAHPLRRRHRGPALPAADGQRQALAPRAAALALRRLRVLRERGIGMYGGGQFELGPGRGHIQYLASLFHPDTPNDVAPGGLQRPRRAGGAAGEPAGTGSARDRLPLGLARPQASRARLYQLRTFPWALAERPFAMVRPVNRRRHTP